MRAIITGISGQDGSYLAEFLLSRGYEVHGAVRPASQPRLDRIQLILDRIHLHQADLVDQLSLIRLIEGGQPDEVYNLAGPSLPSASWRHPIIYGEALGMGVTRLLEAVRLVNSDIRIFQPSSCEMYGEPMESPQTERTPFAPTSPHGAAKLYAHRMAVNYRQAYNMNVSCGILFDHESPRRGTEFVTRQISRAAARIKLGLQDRLVIDSLSVHRDWGYAGDFVRAYWMMLQHDTPDDYVVATGHTRSLEDVCRLAFEAVELDWKDHVRVQNPSVLAPRIALRGDTSYARRKLLWEPEVTFGEMIRMMVEADLEYFAPANRLYSDRTETTPIEENRI